MKIDLTLCGSSKTATRFQPFNIYVGTEQFLKQKHAHSLFLWCFYVFLHRFGFFGGCGRILKNASGNQ